MGASVSQKDPDWEKVSREWKESGLNQRDFCLDRGYSYGSFKNARARLGLTRQKRKSRKNSGRESRFPQSVGFLPLTVEDKALTGCRAERTVKAELELPFGMVLRFYETEPGR